MRLAESNCHEAIVKRLTSPKDRRLVKIETLTVPLGRSASTLKT